MSKSHCEEIQERYKELQQLALDFKKAVENAGKTGNYQEAKKLKARWQVLTSETAKRLIVTDADQEAIKKKFNANDVYDVYYQPDLTLAGRVKLENGIWVPFSGDRLFTQIAGETIVNASNIHTQPNGNLAGRVWLEGHSDVQDFIQDENGELRIFE